MIEVALTTVLLICAGLLLQSFRQLQRVELGFDVTNVLTARISLPDARYASPQQAAAFFEQLTERTRRIPGVVAVSAISSLPLSGNQFAVSFGVEGASLIGIGEFRVISPDYFRTMGTRLIKGRDFTKRDGLQAPAVVIINETLAERFFPGENAVGRRISFEGTSDNQRWREIVGVVPDVKWQRPDQKPTPEAYLPHAQVPFVPYAREPFYMTLAVRTATDPHRIIKALEVEVHALDKDLPLL
ncbi:MAG: ABC transporter permease [Pyrinomonadaceae bacterium]